MTEALLLAGDSFSEPNLFYKTHFLAGDLFFYVECGGTGTIVINGFEAARAQKEAEVSQVIPAEEYGYLDLVKETHSRFEAFRQVMGRAVRAAGAHSVVVDAHFPAVYADSLRQQGIDVRVDPTLLRDERRQKSAWEIAAIEAAQRATERAAQRAIAIIAESEARDGVLHYEGAPLTSERLRIEIDVALVRQDMDTSLSPIAAGGAGAADPHFLGAGPLREGEAIVLDIFPRSKQSRYFADMTRTVVKGKPNALLGRMYDAVVQAQEAAFAHIRAGVNGSDVHQVVLDVFRAAGFDQETGPRYIHGTGHGVGLDIHEPPSLGVAGDELLENEVVTVEPGLYDPEVGAVRIEDLVVVTADGYRNLTDFPKQFQV